MSNIDTATAAYLEESYTRRDGKHAGLASEAFEAGWNARGPGHPINGRVWHIPQVPGQPFHVPVTSLEEAKLVLRTLAQYDQFQLDHRIKPDYANAQGLEVWADDEWIEWTTDEGQDINEVMREEMKA